MDFLKDIQAAQTAEELFGGVLIAADNARDQSGVCQPPSEREIKAILACVSKAAETFSPECMQKLQNKCNTKAKVVDLWKTYQIEFPQSSTFIHTNHGGRMYISDNFIAFEH